MAKKKSIIVFGIGRRNHLIEIIKSECHKRNLELIGCDASPYAASRSLVDKFFQVPYASHNSYLTSCEKLIIEVKPLSFMTIIDPEIVILGQLSFSDFHFQPFYANPQRETALICEDKLSFYSHLNDKGISVVETSELPIFDVPLISKDRRGSCASNFTLYKEKEMISQLDGIIFQPYIDGQHYCIDAYFDLFTGELIDLCAKEVLEKRNGETLIARLVKKDLFVKLISLVANSIQLKGIVNFDIYKHEGKLKVMEVNARIGGNYPISHIAGANLIGLLLDQLLGKQQISRFNLTYKEGETFAKSYYVNKIMQKNNL